MLGKCRQCQGNHDPLAPGMARVERACRTITINRRFTMAPGPRRALAEAPTAVRHTSVGRVHPSSHRGAHPSRGDSLHARRSLARRARASGAQTRARRGGHARMSGEALTARDGAGRRARCPRSMLAEYRSHVESEFVRSLRLPAEPPILGAYARGRRRLELHRVESGGLSSPPGVRGVSCPRQ